MKKKLKNIKRIHLVLWTSFVVVLLCATTGMTQTQAQSTNQTQGGYVVNLSWTQKQNGSDSVRIERRQEGGLWEIIATLPNTRMSHADTTADPRKSYEYRVVPVGVDNNEEDQKTQESSTKNVVDSFISGLPAPIRFAEEVAEDIMPIAGVTASVGSVVVSTGMTLFLLEPFTLSGIISKFFSLLGLASFFARKKRNWGIVFDAQTRRPLPFVRVELVEDGHKIVDATTTDKDGRFGFLTKGGTYTLRFAKEEYAFLPRKIQDTLYGEIYDGTKITVRPEQILSVNVAMEGSGINWKDFAQKRAKTYRGLPLKIVNVLLEVGFFGGMFFTAIATLRDANPINIGIMIFYLTVVTTRLATRKKDYGEIVTKDKKPVPFATVGLYEKNDANRRVNFAVSDTIGRFLLLADDGGEYNVKVKGQPVSGVDFEKIFSKKISNGGVRDRIVV
ncbi:MAG: carboxypeptidase regulatory-like domain-containing protein [Candidatus Moranbacteria bacterium]|nr:carboxypeptidase regulatory-like domain-containing protein [Candidatus Moranbacteria bacterium]